MIVIHDIACNLTNYLIFSMSPCKAIAHEKYIDTLNLTLIGELISGFSTVIQTDPREKMTIWAGDSSTENKIKQNCLQNDRWSKNALLFVNELQAATNISPHMNVFFTALIFQL